MNMKRSIVIVLSLLVVVLVAGAVVMLTQKKNPSVEITNNNSTATSSPATTSSSTANTASPATQPGAAATILYTNTGFSPGIVKVKAGDKIQVTNSSSNSLEFDSDPHPAHTANPDLNVGSISPGKSATFTVTKTGSHGYHNHANAKQTGTIVVE